jgi:hypothetical protein
VQYIVNEDYLYLVQVEYRTWLKVNLAIPRATGCAGFNENYLFEYRKEIS